MVFTDDTSQVSAISLYPAVFFAPEFFLNLGYAVQSEKLFYREVSVMQRQLIGLLLALLLAPGIVSQAAMAGGDAHLVIIKDFKFSPQEVTVKAGDTIRWENHEKRQYHSVWFETSGEEEPDYFFPEEFFERSFDTSGNFPYRCGPHPRMTGVVHVTD